MTDNTLKPCPFCGGKAEITDWECSNSPRWLAKVECVGCCASTHSYAADNRLGCFDVKNGKHKSEAIAAWNTRAAAPDTVTLDRALAALLAVVNATRAYLPPDGIDAQECLNRILDATDNPEINPIIAKAEGR